MIYGDYHLHTTFCDGKSSAEEMVLSAINKGLTRMGFSIHSEGFDSFPPMHRNPEIMTAYRAEIARLKEAYRDRIEILCGVESDFYFPVNKSDFDYTVGSVHYLNTPDGLTPVDWKPHLLLDAAEKYYGGDFMQIAKEYFATVSRLGEIHPDIIGHFDLISKYNEGDKLFDSNDPRYLEAAFDAVDALLPLGVPFEINTGAISRGYRTHPYPAEPILQYILAHGGKVMLNSDSHAAQNVAFAFENWKDLVPAEDWYDHRLIGKK